MSDDIILNEPVVTQQDRIEYALRVLVHWLCPQILRGNDVTRIEEILEGEKDSRILDWMSGDE